MVILNKNMKMSSPNEQTFWDNIYALGKLIAPWATVGVVCNKLINTLFKYYSDKRDAELREIVRKEVQPKLDALEEKVDRLSGLIFELKNKIK